MTYYTAFYKTLDGVELEDNIEDAYTLAMAYKEAKTEAKRHGWILIKVRPKKYDPIPHVFQRQDPYPYYPTTHPTLMG